MYLARLRTQLQKDWPAITQAEAASALKYKELVALIQQAAAAEGPIDSEDISIVVFGSLARGEWTSGSDLDWTLLIDGQADHRHVQAAYRLTTLLSEGGFASPGRTGTFGSLTFSHNLIHQIGGQDDTNRNTTQRMLLLLEARAVSRQDALERVVRGILRRYLENDFRDFRLRVPRFLVNDLHRFWRTVCVDYASKYRERAAEGWAIRNVKLRMSRKLIFAAGLIACYSCDPVWLREREPHSAAGQSIESMVGHLEKFANRPPLDILAEVLIRHPQDETAKDLFDSYDSFLGRLNDPEARKHLERLRPEDAADERFQLIQQECSRFESALEQLFFGESTPLARMTRTYGVF